MVEVMKHFACGLLSLTLGCSGAHLLEVDGGASADAAPDAAPVSRVCRLPPAATPAVLAGEGCYCDGPFVVRGDLAYRQSFLLEVIDVGVPGAPQLVASVPSRAVFAADVAVIGDVLFAAGGELESFDLADPRAPVSRGLTALGGQVEAMATDDTRLLVVITREDQSHALVTIDATDPRALHIGGALELGTDTVQTLALRGDFAFAIAMDLTGAAGTARVISFDVSDAAAPRMLDALPAEVGWLASLGLHDHRLFVSGIETNVTAIDVSDPSALRDLGVVLEITSGARAVAISGDVLVVGGSSLELYDLAAPGMTSLGATEVVSDTPHAVVTGTQLLGSGGNALFSIPLACD
jgi:hypothetical protein